LVEVVGSDHVAQMNVVLPITCVGPLDTITILVNISPNPDWPSKARKIRVNKIQVFSTEERGSHTQVSIEEILSLRPPPGNEMITKKKRVLRTDLDCSGVKLDVLTLEYRSIWLTICVDKWDCPRNSHSTSLQGSTGLQGRNRGFCLIRLSITHGIYHGFNIVFYRISIDDTSSPFWSQRSRLNATNPCLLVGFGNLLTDPERYRKGRPIGEEKGILSTRLFNTE